MREPEPAKVPIGISMSNLTMDQFMDIEDEPDRFERVWQSGWRGPAADLPNGKAHPPKVPQNVPSV
jgi:hypothetical protein